MNRKTPLVFACAAHLRWEGLLRCKSQQRLALYVRGCFTGMRMYPSLGGGGFGKCSGLLCQVKQRTGVAISASRCHGIAGSILHYINHFTVHLI